MRKLLLVFFVLLLIAGCTKKESSEIQKPVLSVSILPQKYFVERITGDKYDINVLLPPGMSPHTFEPAPKTLVDLGRSSVYFTLGHLEFEKAWMNKFISVNPKLVVKDTSTGAGLISYSTKHEGCDHHDHHDHHDHLDHEGIDPHIWMSVREVRTIAGNILDQMIYTDPANAEFFRTNHSVFIKDMEKLDMQIRTMLQDAENRKFIIYHPALSYFARDYGFEEISIEIDGKEPSPAQMKKVIDTARELGIKTVFVQKQFDSRTAASLAKEIGGSVVEIDPLSDDWINNMIVISRTLQGSAK